MNRLAIASTLLLWWSFFPQSSSAVTVHDVQPHKITYLVGENASAKVVLKNSGTSDAKGLLKVTDEWDVDGANEVFRQEVVVPGNKEVGIDVQWVINNHCYGHALTAEFLIEDKVAARKAEFYQVSRKDNWFRTFILNGGGKSDAPTDKEYPYEKPLASPYVTYSNYRNFFSYALSDAVAMTPGQYKFYYSGQTAYPVNVAKMKDSIRKSRERGIRCGGYTQTVTGGPAGYEFARQHPDWFVRDARGAFHTSGAPVSPLDVDAPADRKPSEKYTTRSFYMLVPDFGKAEMRKYAASEIVRAMDAYGFDAMYFDTYPYGVFHYPNRGYDKTMFASEGEPLNRGKDPDAFTAEILREVREIISRRAAQLDAVVWYNGVFANTPWKEQAMLAAMEDKHTGGLLELQGKVLINNGPFSNWRVLYERLTNARNRVMKNSRISIRKISPESWDYCMSDCNNLVLDRPAFRLGEGKQQSPDEILRIDRAARKNLGLTPRGGEMVQPWARQRQANSRRLPVELNYRFDVKTLPSGGLFIGMERPDLFSITINGTDICTLADAGWWTDKSLRKIPVDPTIFRIGRNEIVLKCDYDEDHPGLEAVYLLGHFGVKVCGTDVCMTALPKNLTIGDWVKQGLAFYSGSVSYLTTISPKVARGQRVFVRVPGYKGVAVRVLVEGRLAGTAGWEPNEVEITHLLKGGKERIAIEVLGHRRNSHGPLHLADAMPIAIGPFSYVTSGKRWTDKYQLVECGLTEAPQLVVK